MDFYTLKSYSLSDIENLIENEVEENIHLDYKRAEALGKDDKKKAEITKDISAFANSDGGIIIYGIEEINHKPVSFSPIDGEKYSKEWLEQICHNIQQHIPNIEISPLRIDGDISKSIYIVKIPRSSHAPHMATDHKYYKRYNFQSVAMEEYEVRDLFFRAGKSELVIDFFNVTPTTIDEFYDSNNYYNYDFRIGIVNVTETICQFYKLSIYMKYSDKWCDYIFSAETHNVYSFSHTIIGNGVSKFSYTAKEPIFPEECLDICLTLKILYSDLNQFLEASQIKFAIWYDGGVKFYNYNVESKKLIEDNKLDF